jgi:ribosomal protein L37E
VTAAWQRCPRCHARAYHVADGLGVCRQCKYRARTAPTALEVTWATLHLLLQEWPRNETWPDRWLQAHAAWRAALV